MLTDVSSFYLRVGVYLQPFSSCRRRREPVNGAGLVGCYGNRHQARSEMESGLILRVSPHIDECLFPSQREAARMRMFRPTKAFSPRVDQIREEADEHHFLS